MKKKYKISFILCLVTIFSTINANAKESLKGNASLENFIGSAGMWVIFIGVVILIAFVIFTRKNSKLIPDPVHKKEQ